MEYVAPVSERLEQALEWGYISNGMKLVKTFVERKPSVFMVGVETVNT